MLMIDHAKVHGSRARTHHERKLKLLKANIRIVQFCCKFLPCSDD